MIMCYNISSTRNVTLINFKEFTFVFLNFNIKNKIKSTVMTNSEIVVLYYSRI